MQVKLFDEWVDTIHWLIVQKLDAFGMDMESDRITWQDINGQIDAIPIINRSTLVINRLLEILIPCVSFSQRCFFAMYILDGMLYKFYLFLIFNHRDRLSKLLNEKVLHTYMWHDGSAFLHSGFHPLRPAYLYRALKVACVIVHAVLGLGMSYYAHNLTFMYPIHCQTHTRYELGEPRLQVKMKINWWESSRGFRTRTKSHFTWSAACLHSRLSSTDNSCKMSNLILEAGLRLNEAVLHIRILKNEECEIDSNNPTWSEGRRIRQTLKYVVHIWCRGYHMLAESHCSASKHGFELHESHDPLW